jgi:hypothetical protein
VIWSDTGKTIIGLLGCQWFYWSMDLGGIRSPRPVGCLFAHNENEIFLAVARSGSQNSCGLFGSVCRTTTSSGSGLLTLTFFREWEFLDQFMTNSGSALDIEVLKQVDGVWAQGLGNRQTRVIICRSQTRRRPH